MPTLPILFAFRTSWVGMLVLIGCVFVVWFAVRVVMDTITWVREEFFDDASRGGRERSRRSPHEKDPEGD